MSRLQSFLQKAHGLYFCIWYPIIPFQQISGRVWKKSTSRWVVIQCTFQQQVRQRTYIQPSLLTKPLLNTGQQPSFNTHTDGPTLGTRYRTRPSSCCISGGDSLSLSVPELDPVSLQLSLSASVLAKVLSQRKIQLEEGSDWLKHIKQLSGLLIGHREKSNYVGFSKTNLL